MFTFQGEGGWGNTTTTNTTTATTTMQRTKNHQLQHQNNNSNNNNQRRRQRPKTIPSRVFSKWNGSTTLPCFPPTDIGNNTHNNNNNNNNTQQHQQQLQFLHWTDKRNLKRPATDGLFFLKLLKTGSTTASSIHVRIAYNLARRRRRHRQWNNHTNATTAVTTTTTTSSTTTSNNEYYYPICATRHLHGWAGPRMYHYGQRHAATSLLWTILREPTARYLSEFFHFQVSRRAGTPVSRAIISYLRSGPHSDHHYLSWLSTRRSYNGRGGRGRGRGRPYVIAQQILQDYDFIGITERMDESAVALMMLLPQEQISMADILYLNSKTAGGYDDGAYGNTCVKIRPVEISAELQAYLDSPEWKAYIAPEEALYRAVNQSLDRTIDALGRFEFERNLKRFRHAQRVVQETCAPVVKFPCSLTGELRAPEETDCLHGDVGCGFDCLDKVATELELW